MVVNERDGCVKCIKETFYIPSLIPKNYSLKTRKSSDFQMHKGL